MEIINENGKPAYNSKIIYKGNGADLFGIYILNWLLTAITLGLYYPWAKAKNFNIFFPRLNMQVLHFNLMEQVKKCLKDLLKRTRFLFRCMSC